MATRKQRTARRFLSGQKWRNTHQRTIDAIIDSSSPDHRRVISKGTSFYNVDQWVLRIFVKAMCDWAKLNPGKRPTRDDVHHWVYHANAAGRWNMVNGTYDPHIVIGETPDDLPKWFALALVAGGYHEIWHTLYSRRDELLVDVMWGIVDGAWDRLEYDPLKGKFGWAGLSAALLSWSNLIEDIYIERRGTLEYPGSRVSMPHLQDLILKQEQAGLEAAEHRGLPVDSYLRVITGTFRDLGLGYDSPRQKVALAGYRRQCREAYDFVESGPLSGLLERSIKLAEPGGNEGGLGSFELSMEVMITISDLVQRPPGPKRPPGRCPQDDDGEIPIKLEPDDESDQPPPPPGERPKKKGRKLYYVGDVAEVKTGPNKGRFVKVTWAGLPDSEGKQELHTQFVANPKAGGAQ